MSPAPPPTGTLETRVAAWLAAAAQEDWDLAHAIRMVMPEPEWAVLRLAVVERDRQLRAGDVVEPLPPCPECQQRKCGNCTGDTWDPILDEPAPCPCHANGHAPAG